LGSKRILIAGAGGAAGYELLKQAKAAGYWVRAQTRATANYSKLAPHANDVVLADATNALALEGLTRDVDIVVSCLGAPVAVGHPERRGYHRIDFIGNRNLMEQAKANGVERFVYVSVHLAPGYAETAYVRAHEAFVDHLQLSGLKHTVVRPTGMFNVFLDLLAYAKLGMVPLIGDGMARTNPIHEADVARVLLENLEEGPPAISCGGPEIFKRRELVELMFRMIGRPARIVRMPPGLFRVMGKLAGLTSARKAELLEFAGAVSVSNAIAPLVGKERLQDYIAAHILGR
jgi:uncharacterized protein YbjT (DUF2867 family)